MRVYGEPDGTLVLDFTRQPEKRLIASRRTTSNSRGAGGQQGVVYFERIGLKRCADCGTVVPADTKDGTHAPHSNGAGQIVNCVGKALAWPL